MGNFHLACKESLFGCASASLGDFHSAFESTTKAIEYLREILPSNHTVLGTLLNQLGVLMATNGDLVSATTVLEKALNIFSKTSGTADFPYNHTRFNKIIVDTMYSRSIDVPYLQMVIQDMKHLYPNNYPFPSQFDCEKLLANLRDMLQNCANSEEISHFLWQTCFVSLLDCPFSWIDYPPSSHAVIFGADYQVWAHLDSLLHTHPLRYSWISSTYLGSFHKLGNIHAKLLKRYGKFHLEKDAVAFLDDPTTPKVQLLLSMKDFDTSNQFFYHDVLAGLTELALAYIHHSNEDLPTESASLKCIDIASIREFCDKFVQFHPGLKVITDYLFTEGISVLGFLDAQKFGDFELDMLFTKLVAPLQFTTRGINYGPVLVYHIRDMEQLRPFERTAVRNLWVSNKSDEPGHCRPQDQNLEALFNNSAKNCFKLGNVQNVLNKASMIQEREKSHRNLQTELQNDNKAKPTLHQFRAESFLHLRAAWHKGINSVFEETKANKQNNITDGKLFALHSKSVTLNSDLTTVRETGKNRLDKFVAVKINQENGWCLQNPKFPEVIAVPRAPTARQQKAALNQANVQIEAMTDLLLQSTGMQVTLSESCVLIQLPKKDEKSYHFAKKSDLTQWLFKHFESAFIHEAKFESETNQGRSVSCVIRDCMFEFCTLNMPTCTYRQMASTIIDKTVIPIANRYANKDKHFTLIQTFDRRADQTKGSTEMTRASAPVSPLEYSGIQVDENEQIKAYKTSWLDRDNGRQKIITSYVRACQDLPFLDKKRLPHNFSHVIIGGNSGIFAAYTVDNFGNVSFLGHDYACLHAEADTVVFFAFKRFILNNPGTTGSSVVINCPEADNVTILLLEHQLISEVIENHDISLYCTVHNKIVDAKTGKPTKKQRRQQLLRSLGV